MTIEEYNTRIEGVISDLRGGAHAEVMAQVAQEALTMMRQRVTETGMDAEGRPYKDYSESYKEYKKQEGKYKGFVDFSFTNRMWSNIKLTSPQDELRLGTARIKATTPFEQEKLRKNTASRGNILDLTDDEKELLKESYRDEILEIFKRNGLL